MIQLKASRNSGFSLIEMAIVLAIIGLILGGIMLGQDLLRAAQLQKVQSDIQQYDAAVQQFYQKYNSLPGDMPDATTYWSGVNNGNGNFTIDSTNEMFGTWQQMSLAGFIGGTYTGVSTGTTPGSRAGTNVPATAVDGVVAQMRYVTTCALTGEVSLANIFEVNYSLGADGFANGSSWLTSAEAQSLDAKMDDGFACRGRFRGIGGASCPAYNATTGDYSLSASGLGCGINYLTDRFK